MTDAPGGNVAPGSQSDDLESRLELIAKVFRLKEEERSGWTLRGVTNPESVADHSWGTALLCLLFAEDAGVDPARALGIAVVHDLAEAITGDMTARADPADRHVSEASKATLEAAAIEELLPSNMPTFAKAHALWLDYERRADEAARFVRDMNLIDMCLQAAHYEAEQRYDPNVVVPSQGDFEHLDEFFVSAETRLASDLARQLFAAVKAKYLVSRERFAQNVEITDRDLGTEP